MAATWKTWLISTAAATGVVGGAAVGLASASGPAAPHTDGTESAQTVPTTSLQAQVAELQAEDTALKSALAAARARLDEEVASSERSLRTVRQQLAAAQAALAAERRLAAAAAAQAAPAAPSSSTAPPAHTSTGASGASSTGDGGGHDD